MSIFHRRKAVPPTAEAVRVYTQQGRKAHLMLGGTILCPTEPGPAGWRGAADESEREYAAVIPLCSYCRDALAGLTP